MTEERLHTRVGAGVLVGLAVAVALVFAVSGRHLAPGFRVHVDLERTGPITEGTPVKLAGRTVGEVQAIRMRPQGVTLDLWIEKDWRKHLHANSEFFINQATVFGEAYVEIGPPRGGEPGPVLDDGATVRGADPPRLDRLLLKSYQNLEAVTSLLREGVPEAQELGRALDELEKTLGVVEPSAGAYGRTWSAGLELYREAGRWGEALEKSDTSLAAMRETAARAGTFFARSRRELGALSSRLDRLAADVDRLSARVTPERLARFEQAIARARVVIADVDRLLGEGQAFVAMVQAGEGTVGAFLRDEEIADDMKQLMKLMKTRPWVTVGHPQ